MKYFYNPEFGLVTKKNLLQAKCDICSFYFRGLNLIRICIIVYSIVVVLVVKSPPANAGDVRGVGWLPGSGGAPAGQHGNPLQCSCLENPLDRGAWWATHHGVTKSRTPLKQLSTHAQDP